MTESGTYRILVGNSSRDIVLSKEIQVICHDPFGWNVITGIGKLVSNPKAVEIMNQATGDDINLVAAVPIQYGTGLYIKGIMGDRKFGSFNAF